LLCKRVFKIGRIEDMKIGIFDPYLDALSGGERYMLGIAKCLLQKHEVFVFWDQKDEKTIKDQALYKLGIDIEKAVFVSNIFSKEVPLISRLKSSRFYDLIIFLSNGSLPFVLTNLYIHFQFPTVWVKGSLINGFKLKKISAVFCNSFFTKKYIDKEFGIKSRVLYPPANINIKYQISNIKNKENLILTVGRFGRLPEGNHFKKQDVMISAFKQMIDKGLSSWEFILVISYREKDIEEVKELGRLAKGYPVKIFENLTMREISKFYKKAKIYWHAAGFGEDLEKHPERVEHFGISTVEAMGAGAVPVVINAGGQKEIVEDRKNGFLWDTIDDLTMFTTRLINNKKLLIKMSEAAIKRSKVFAGDRFCRELNSILF